MKDSKNKIYPMLSTKMSKKEKLGLEEKR